MTVSLTGRTFLPRKKGEPPLHGAAVITAERAEQDERGQTAEPHALGREERLTEASSTPKRATEHAGTTGNRLIVRRGQGGVVNSQAEYTRRDSKPQPSVPKAAARKRLTSA